MFARSLGYAHFLESEDRSEMLILKKRGARTDPCGTPFLRRRNLLRLPFPVVSVKLQLLTISMIMQIMRPSGSNHSGLQVRLQYHL